jgi:hypothetical protein
MPLLAQVSSMQARTPAGPEVRQRPLLSRPTATGGWRQRLVNGCRAQLSRDF